MAKEEHLTRLMQGVDTWNRWREEHPEVKPDLFKAVLERAFGRRTSARHPSGTRTSTERTSIGEKGVLILGRFTKERKTILNAIRNRLRELGFVPMMFDFERPTQRDFTETIKTLAGMSRFIIADITNPKSSPLELQAIMPNYMIPFVPIIQEDEEPFAMFRDLKQKYGEWVLDVLKYDTAESLLHVLERAVVRPALEKGQQLLLKKAEVIQARHVRDYK
jgi:hypothetical protein